MKKSYQTKVNEFYKKYITNPPKTEVNNEYSIKPNGNYKMTWEYENSESVTITTLY